MKNILLISMIITIFASCSKEPAPVPDPPLNKNVTKISSAANDYQSFEYNTQNELTKYIAQWENGTGTVNKITHTLEYAANKLVKATNDIGYVLYAYQGNLVVKTDNFLFNGKKLSTILLHYSQQNRLEYLVEQNAELQPENAEETKVTYQYYNEGNVKRMDFAYRMDVSSPFVLSYSKVFEAYDSKHHPVPDDVLGKFLPGIALYANNPVKISNLDKNGILTGYNRYEYVYNQAGYPTHKKQFIWDGNSEQLYTTFAYRY
ncbi:MAG: hypothetical protein ABIQ31_00120 [Ferruginibacter sp.]